MTSLIALCDLINIEEIDWMQRKYFKQTYLAPPSTDTMLSETDIRAPSKYGIVQGNKKKVNCKP